MVFIIILLLGSEDQLTDISYLSGSEDREVACRCHYRRMDWNGALYTKGLGNE